MPDKLGALCPPAMHCPQQMPLMSILHHGRDIITPTLDDSLPWAEKPHPKHWHARCRQAAFLPWQEKEAIWCPVQALTSCAVNCRKEWRLTLYQVKCICQRGSCRVRRKLCHQRYMASAGMG